MRNGKITRQMTATGTVEYILKWQDFAVPGIFSLKPLLLLALSLTWAAPLFADEPLTFEKHVRPILCFIAIVSRSFVGLFEWSTKRFITFGKFRL